MMSENATKGLRMVLLMIAAALLFTSVQAAHTGTLIYFNILYDAPPTVQFVAPTPLNGTYNATQTINVTANDTNLANMTIYMNGTIAIVCNSSPCSYTLTQDGTFTFYAVANDTGGNSNSTESRTIVIDKTPPLVQFVSPTPTNGTYNTTQTLNLTANDTNLSSIVIFVNGSAVQTCYSSPCNYTLTSDGNYTVYGWANDTLGNTNTTEIRNIIVDKTPPQIQFVGPTPVNGTYNTTQTINVTASDTNLANITITVNGSIVKTCGYSPCLYNLTQDGVYTFYATANDTAGNTNSTAPRTIIIDKTPPQIQFVAPTPLNGTYNTTQTINVTASDANLSTIVIYVNGSIVKTCGYSPCLYNLTGEGNYTFYSVANDTAGNTNRTETRNIVIDQTPPLIIETAVSPYAIINGTNVSLYINATSFSWLWAEIRRPDGSKENVTLTDEANTIYSNTGIIGIYNVTFYANDTAGNIVSKKDHFEAFQGILLDINVTNSSIIGINSMFISYYRNGTVALNQSAIGYYVIYVPNTTLDLEFYAYDSRIIVTTYNIDLMDAAGKYVGMDVHRDQDGFLITYGAEPQWNVSSGKVRIKYDDVNYTNEDNLNLYKCDDFNFTEMKCTGTWNNVTSSATQNRPQDYFEITVTGFSGFSIKEVTPATPSGGITGGGGGGGEKEKEKECLEDWKCGAWGTCFNGMQTRECTDVNGCGTDQYKPVTRMPCFEYCSARWECADWGSCTASGIQTRECNDAAQCGTRRGMPATQQNCGYDFCHDGIQDNGEDGVDCGGNCEACRRIERPAIFEYKQANILCELMPLFVLAMFLLLLLAAGFKIEAKRLKPISAFNLTLMIIGLVMILPAAKFPQGACMAIADTMPLIDEILWFLAVTFTILLIEGLFLIYLKRKELLIPPEPPHKREQRGKKALVLMILGAAMIIAFSISMIINIKAISDTRAESTQAATSSFMVYMPFIIAMLILVSVLFSMKEPEPPTPPEEKARTTHAKHNHAYEKHKEKR
jgi:hypothetical protein